MKTCTCVHTCILMDWAMDLSCYCWEWTRSCSCSVAIIYMTQQGCIQRRGGAH